MNNEIDFSKLRFVRIFDPIHIPVELVEQVRDRRYSVEKFYEYQRIVCIANGQLNPLNLLYVIVNEKHNVKGFLWATVNPLTQDIIINTFSMDKEYWGKGQAVKLVEDKVKEIVKECKLNKVFWITNYPKHSERYGFKRSKSILMEYQEVEDGRDTIRIGGQTDGNSQSDDASTEEISGKHIRLNAGAC